ncbi:MAG TPA: hypothetical protein VHY37_03425, partial [Tepidisphaeraceae bacterium]|nr:hypothetical protein [Tepidisphaeraceae bacterium]
LIQSAPDLARHAIDQYLKDRSAGRCFTVAEALSAGDESWEVDVLLPMLSDKRATKWGRVCDEAAATLSQLYPNMKFDSAGSDANRDKQIEAMIKALLARRSGK